MPLFQVKTKKFGVVLREDDSIKAARQWAKKAFPKQDVSVETCPRKYKLCERCDSKPCCCSEKVPAKPLKLYVCSECGCPDVEGTGWIHLNSDMQAEGDPPLDMYWCPSCGGHFEGVCLVDPETGQCEFDKSHRIKPRFDWVKEEKTDEWNAKTAARTSR